MSFKTPQEIANVVGAVNHDHFVVITNGASPHAAEKCTTKQLIEASLGNSSSIEFNSNNTLSIKPGAVDSLEIASGAITLEKIPNGIIDLTKLKTSGSNSIPINSLKRRTLCLHVGNYFRNGVKMLSDDSLSYDSSINRYLDRTESVVNSSDPSSLNDAWGGMHKDSTEVHIVEPFATLGAAARFAEYNYGPNINALFLIHGHVSAVGSYDLNVNKRIANVDYWNSFDNVAIISGSPPDYNSADSHYMHYFQDGNTLARIDWDQDIKSSEQEREKALGLCFSGPNVTIAGLNIVFKSSSNFPNLSNKFIGGNHYISGVRMMSTGDIDNFTPYNIERSSNMFFGNKDIPNACNEFYFAEDGILFRAHDNSTFYYAKESDNNDILLDGFSHNAEIRFAHLSESSKIDLGSNNAEVLIRSEYNLNESIAPIILENGRNTYVSRFAGSYYLCGGSGAGWWDTATHGFQIVNSDFDAFYDNAGSMSGPANRKPYVGAQGLSPSSISNSILKRHQSSSYKSGMSSLNAIRLTGKDAFKLSPSSRASNPYSDQ